MKKFFKTAAMPMAVFAIAIGSAFATNAMKSTFAAEQGYQQLDNVGIECIQRASCDTDGTVTCTWKVGSVTHNLYGMQFDSNLGRTACTKPLYIKP